MGKDNITFHAQIWPAELLGYNGQGARGGEPGAFGELDLPTEVVSSEFLTMEGRQFSSSRGVVIYVRDLLARYQPDALRYFISAAGPENQDTDFTWAEFVRRTNDELVAGWGNLVNRTAQPDPQEPRRDPRAGRADRRRPRRARDNSKAAFDVVGGLIERAPAEAGAGRGDAGRRRGQQVPVRHRRRGSSRDGPRADGHRAARCRAGGLRRRTLLAPFLPFSAQAVHEVIRRHRGGLADAGDPRGRRPRRRPRLPGPDG